MKVIAKNSGTPIAIQRSCARNWAVCDEPCTPLYRLSSPIAEIATMVASKTQSIDARKRRQRDPANHACDTAGFQPRMLSIGVLPRFFFTSAVPVLPVIGTIELVAYGYAVPPGSLTTLHMPRFQMSSTHAGVSTWRATCGG